MKNILFIALSLIISVGTASAADASATYSEYFINKKRAEAKMLKNSSDKKVALYKNLIANKKPLITGMRPNVLGQEVQILETASGGASSESDNGESGIVIPAGQ